MINTEAEQVLTDLLYPVGLRFMLVSGRNTDNWMFDIGQGQYWYTVNASMDETIVQVGVMSIINRLYTNEHYVRNLFMPIAPR